MPSFRAWILTKLYDAAMRRAERRCLSGWRKDLLASISGTVLEVGAGTGANLGHYPSGLTGLVMSEPHRPMVDALDERTRGERHRGAMLTSAAVEDLPFPDASFDFVVSTLVLCSVRDPEQGLAEIFRVLKPGGGLIFLEHVAAEASTSTFRWQRRLEPLFVCFGGNCHLTRRTGELIRAAGMAIERVECGNIGGALCVDSPVIRGLARKPA